MADELTELLDTAIYREIASQAFYIAGQSRTEAAGDFVTATADRDGLHLLRELNGQHLQQRADDTRLQARIRSYELAAAMQLSAPEALDLSGEPEHIMRLYGLDRIGTTYPSTINPAEEAEYFGRKCLIARRLIERGVRFVQIWSGNDNSFLCLCSPLSEPDCSNRRS